MYRQDPGPTTHRRYAATKLLAELETHGVPIPAPVAKCRQELAAIEARARGELKAQDHRQAALNALAEKPTADVTPHLLAEELAPRLANLLKQATDEARGRLLRAVTHNSDNIIIAIRTELFAPAVEILRAAAHQTHDDDAATLLRAGNLEAAKFLAEVPAAAERVSTAYRLRGAIYYRGSIGDMPCAAWENPHDVPPSDLTGPSYWLHGIRHGGRLWYGTYAEVEDASRAWKRQRDQELQDQMTAYIDQNRRRRHARLATGDDAA